RRRRMTTRRVAVVGAGTMGHGIAYVATLAGCSVALTDSRPEAIPPAIRRIGDLFTGGVKRGKLGEADVAAAAARLRADRDLDSAVREADVVIEAVVEDLGVKQRLFAELERAAPAEALLATNSSSLSLAAIASGIRRPSRLVGMHFFNPVHVMKLVEVIQSPAADRAAVDRAVELARVFGKEPIVVRDSPGFASSRLGVALGLEAIPLLEQRVASAQHIDRALVVGQNPPRGPRDLTDRVGLDARLA